MRVVKRVTPEEIEGVRRLLSERPLGGLRPVEIPRAVLDRLAEAFFGLAEVQDSVADFAELPPIAKRIDEAYARGFRDGTREVADQVIRERDELREAGRALVADLESNEGDWPTGCNAPRCRRLATYDDGDQVACDEHQGILVAGDIEDLSYASSYRRLRALLDAKP